MSDPRVMIHIGYHKTATTWFQREFYPSIRNATLVPRRWVLEWLVGPRPLDFDPGRARRRFDERYPGRAIICEEELSGNIHVGGLHGCATVEFARRLVATFPEAEVILFGRNLVDHVASAYQQYVKKGGTLSAERYVFWDRFHHRRPGFSLAHFASGDLADHYRTLFGADRFHLYTFEDFVDHPSGFIDVFARTHNLLYDESDIDWDRRVNVGYGRTTLRLARWLNVFAEQDVSNKYYVVSIPGFFEASRRFLNLLNRVRWFRGRTDAPAILGTKLVQRLRELEH